MKNIKKLLSLLLCGIMLFGMFPASLFAAGGDTGDGCVEKSAHFH